MLQRLLGTGAVGSVVGVGDGELQQPAILEGRGQVLQFAIELQGRAGRHHDADATHRIGTSAVPGLAGVGQLVDEALVGRHEHVKGRTLQDLSLEVARRTKDQPQLLPGLILEARGHLLDGELEVGSGSHRRQSLRLQRQQAGARQRESAQCQGEEAAKGWHGGSPIRWMRRQGA